MQKHCALGLVSFCLLLSSCASYLANDAGYDEQIDLYLRTLDDKHFVWCELDLKQCQKDYKLWKLTPRGRMIIREYENEGTGQKYNMNHTPKVFRMRFRDEGLLAEEPEKHHVRKDADALDQTDTAMDQQGDRLQEKILLPLPMHGPELPSKY